MNPVRSFIRSLPRSIPKGLVRGVLPFLILLSLLGTLGRVIYAIGVQWKENGVVICTETGSQEHPAIVSDGSNGAIITWQDNRGGNFDIYAQRVDSNGNPMWEENGVAICTAPGDQRYPAIVSDGSNGAIITWQDNRGGNFDIYAQRVDSNGNPMWEENGVAICTAPGDQRYPAIVSDGSNGAIITWQDNRGGNFDIYARRINSDGTAMWGENGVVICNAMLNQEYPAIVSDGSGGAIITWQDGRAVGNLNIYARKIDSGGTAMWGENGVVICDAEGNQGLPAIISDGSGGAIITWQDNRGGNFDIYARRINSDGTAMWGENGVVICNAMLNQEYPAIVSDGSGGAIITWQDGRAVGNLNIYARKIDSGGTAMWGENGVVICDAEGNQGLPAIISDGSGGAIITWQDNRGGNFDIYAQRVDSNGTPQWTTNGVAICIAEGPQKLPGIVSDGSNGAIITWQDFRGGNFDIYAQRTISNIFITPTSLNFGDVLVGQSKEKTITIKNQKTSTANLTGSVGSLAAPFSVANGGEFNLAPGSSREVVIRFSPTTVKAFSAKLEITHNATNKKNPFEISIEGGGMEDKVDIPQVGVVEVKKDEAKVVSTERGGTVNPDEGHKAYIAFNPGKPGRFTLRIFTLLGELVHEETKVSDAPADYFEWIPKDLATGTYLVHISGEGTSIRTKVVILR